MQNIHSAIHHQGLSKKALEISIERMQDALAPLGLEPLANEPAAEQLRESLAGHGSFVVE